MGTDYLTFTCRSPSHKAGSATALLLDFTEPDDDWVTIYEVIPGEGVDSKDLGAGAQVHYVFHIQISSDDYSTQVAKLAAWRLLKDGYGSIKYASAAYGPETVTSVRLISIPITTINPLYAEATATFQKVVS